MENRQDRRPAWVREAMGEEHFENCHTRWESEGECICDKIAATVHRYPPAVRYPCCGAYWEDGCFCGYDHRENR